MTKEYSPWCYDRERDLGRQRDAFYREQDPERVKERNRINNRRLRQRQRQGFHGQPLLLDDGRRSPRPKELTDLILAKAEEDGTDADWDNGFWSVDHLVCVCNEIRETPGTQWYQSGYLLAPTLRKIMCQLRCRWRQKIAAAVNL